MGELNLTERSQKELCLIAPSPCDRVRFCSASPVLLSCVNIIPCHLHVTNALIPPSTNPATLSLASPHALRSSPPNLTPQHPPKKQLTQAHPSRRPKTASSTSKSPTSPTHDNQSPASQLPSQLPLRGFSSSHLISR